MASRTTCTVVVAGLASPKIFRPDAIERVLIAEIGDKAIGGDDIGESCADRLQAALEIFERRPRLPLHIRGMASNSSGRCGW